MGLRPILFGLYSVIFVVVVVVVRVCVSLSFDLFVLLFLDGGTIRFFRVGGYIRSFRRLLRRSNRSVAACRKQLKNNSTRVDCGDARGVSS